MSVKRKRPRNSAMQTLPQMTRFLIAILWRLLSIRTESAERLEYKYQFHVGVYNMEDGLLGVLVKSIKLQTIQE